MTEKLLTLMRHAAAVDSHKNGNLARPLTTEGRRQAMQAGMLLAQNGLIPSQIIVSHAARTRETLNEMTEVWGHQPPVIVDERLFQISHGEGAYKGEFHLISSFNDIMAQADPNAERLLVLGHNPAIANLAHMVSRRLPIELTQNYPTATATIVEMASPWDALAMSSALCRKVIYNGSTLIEVKDSRPQGHPDPGP